MNGYGQEIGTAAKPLFGEAGVKGSQLRNTVVNLRTYALALIKRVLHVVCTSKRETPVKM